MTTHSVAGPLRVQPGGLSLSRTLGDRSAKVADHASVIAKSELTMTELDARSLFLVLASDGLWDVMSSNEAVQFVFQRVRELTTPPRDVAKLLVEEAIRRGYANCVCLRSDLYNNLCWRGVFFSEGKERGLEEWGEGGGIRV